MLLAPRLQLRAHRTRARDQRDQPHARLQAQPQRACTGGLTVGHNAVHPVEPERHTRLDGHGGLGAVTGIAIAQAHAEREAIAAHAETQEHLLEIVMAVFAMPALIMASATPFCFCTTQKYLAVKRVRSS